MDVDLLRKVDRLLGVPLCGGLTVLHRLRPTAPRQTPHKVAVLQLSEMGSLTLAWPALQRLKERWPQAELHYVVFERNRKILELLNIIPSERVLTIDDSSGESFLRSSLAFIRRARELQLDTVLDFEIFARASMILSYLSGARNRAGFHNYQAEGLYRGELLTHPVFYNVYQHISLNFLAMVEALASDPAEQPGLKQRLDIPLEVPTIPTPPDRLAAMRQRIQALYPGLQPSQPLIVMSPFSGSLLPIRSWPTRHYVQLIRGLLQAREDALVLLIGLPEAAQVCAEIQAAVGSPRVLDLVGMTRDIHDIADLFNISHLLVTADGGPAHFAALTRIPSLVLFGPETPAMYGPLSSSVRTVFLGYACSPCVSAFNHRATPCTHNRCLEDILPEQLLPLALEALNASRNQPWKP